MVQPSNKSVVINICLGSSCFCRGNNRNVELIQTFLGSAPAGASCQLEGHLCQNQCTRGPNIVIDGQTHHEVDPVTLMVILNERVK